MSDQIKIIRAEHIAVLDMSNDENDDLEKQLLPISIRPGQTRCELCGFDSSESSRLVLHMKCSHPGAVRRTLAWTNDPLLGAIPGDDLRHQLQPRQQQQEEEDRRESRSGMPAEFFCDQCGKMCQDEAGLMVHSWTHLRQRAKQKQRMNRVAAALDSSEFAVVTYPYRYQRGEHARGRRGRSRGRAGQTRPREPETPESAAATLGSWEPPLLSQPHQRGEQWLGARGRPPGPAGQMRIMTDPSDPWPARLGRPPGQAGERGQKRPREVETEDSVSAYQRGVAKVIARELEQAEEGLQSDGVGQEPDPLLGGLGQELDPLSEECGEGPDPLLDVCDWEQYQAEDGGLEPAALFTESGPQRGRGRGGRGRGRGKKRGTGDISGGRQESREERRLRREREKQAEAAVKAEVPDSADLPATSDSGAVSASAGLLRTRCLPMETDSLVNFSALAAPRVGQRKQKKKAAKVEQYLTERHPVFGVLPCDLPASQLPTCGQVVGRLMKTQLEEMRRRDMNENGVKIGDCMRLVTLELWRLWRSSGLPMFGRGWIRKKVSLLWYSKSLLTKNHRWRSKHAGGLWDKMQQKMTTLFDCSLKRKRLEPDSDVARFLADQRTARKMHIDSSGDSVRYVVREQEGQTAESQSQASEAAESPSQMAESAESQSRTAEAAQSQSQTAEVAQSQSQTLEAAESQSQPSEAAESQSLIESERRTPETTESQMAMTAESQSPMESQSHTAAGNAERAPAAGVGSDSDSGTEVGCSEVDSETGSYLADTRCPGGQGSDAS